MANPAREAREKAQQIWNGAVVSSRTRNFIEHRHPANPLRIMLDGGIGPLHITGTETEIDTAWVAAAPEDSPYQRKMALADYNALFGNGNLQLDAAFPFRYVDPQTGDWLNWQLMPNLQWTNDVNSVANVGLTRQAIAAQITDDTLFFAGAYGPGLDLYVQLQTARLQKRLQINSLATIGAPSAAIISGGNPVLMLSYQIQRSAGVTIWVDGVQWSESTGQGNARASLNHLEFKSTDGSTLWYLSPALTWDSGGNFINGPVRIRRAGGSFIVELRVPWEWLQAAVYPVNIDPTIEPQVAASADDGQEAAGGTNNIVATPLLNMDDSGEWNGWRIPGVNISSLSSFDVAYLIFYFTGATLDEPDITIFGLDTAAPAQFNTTASDLSGRTRTTASVDYASTNLGAPGAFNSASIISILSELYTSYGPYSSGVLGFVARSRANDATRDTSIQSYDGDTANAVKIHIEYTQTGGTTKPWYAYAQS